MGVSVRTRKRYVTFPISTQETWSQSSTYSLIGTCSIDFTNISNTNDSTFKAVFSVVGRTDDSTAGDVRLYNKTDNQSIGSIAISSSTDEPLTLEVTNAIPQTGRKIIEVQLARTTGSGTKKSYIAASSLELEIEEPEA